MDPLRTLDAHEIATLKAFRAKYGRWWKSALLNKWKMNRCHLERDGDTLKRLGVTHGADWLRYYQLEEDVACQKAS